MKINIHTYETGDLTIEYDKERCIHAAECVKSLPSVFNTDKQPWIQPENAEPGPLKEIVHCCPTGALKYRDTDAEERPGSQNAIILSPDGPVFLRGDIEIRNAQGETLLKDMRLALCRCGQSRNKPLCDNSHREVDFSAPTSFDSSKLEFSGEDNKEQKKLIVKLMKNGPALIEGDYQMYSIAAQPVKSSKTIALCRCGGSGTKPYCDGTHKNINFKG